jgi:sulfoacetaldehyde dehydrogenase
MNRAIEAAPAPISASAIDDRSLVAGYVERSRTALSAFARFDQEAVDDVVDAVAWAVCNPENAALLARLEVEESKMGNVADKTLKNVNRVFGTVAEMRGKRSVGVLGTDPRTGITRVAKPKGVFAAFVPMTNTVPGLTQNALALVKGGNTVIVSPPRRTRATARKACELVRAELARIGAPEDIVLLLDHPTRGVRDELMRQADVVIATGGAGLVRAAYSSGRPAIGVGPGNAVTILDGTADVTQAVAKIVQGKTFDYATSCSSENAVVVHASIYEEALAALQRGGGQRLSPSEKRRLESVLWTDGVLNEELIGRAPRVIAEAAGLDPEATFFIVEEDDAGPGAPFSGEKLSVVLTAYRYQAFGEAVARVQSILRYQGRGHSCGIHTTNEEHALHLAASVDVCRVLVNQVQALGNSGSFGNGLPFTATLGCGSWGGNSIDGNVTWEHCINVTLLARPIPAVIPSEEDVFGRYHARYGRA